MFYVKGSDIRVSNCQCPIKTREFPRKKSSIKCFSSSGFVLSKFISLQFLSASGIIWYHQVVFLLFLYFICSIYIYIYIYILRDSAITRIRTLNKLINLLNFIYYLMNFIYIHVFKWSVSFILFISNFKFFNQILSL